MKRHPHHRPGIMWLLILYLLSACTLPGTEDQGEVIKIAVIAPFSDDYSILGQSTRNGVVLAVEEWNQRGGLLGHSIQLILEDSQCDYKAGREAAQAAISEGANFIIGAVCAKASEGVAQVAMQESVLQITHAAVNLDLTLDNEGNVRPLVFRVPVTDPDQGKAAALFALESLQADTAAVIYAEDNVYSRTLAEAFVTTFEAGGGDTVSRETYDQETTVFFDSLEDIRDAESDVVYMPGYYNVANQLSMQARNFGLRQVFIGSDGWDAPELDLAATNNSYFTTHYFAREPRATVQAWIQHYQTRYMATPDTLATLAYDAINILLISIEETGNFNPTQVAQTLEELSFEGITGRIAFDAAHNPIKDMVILKVQNGQVLFEKRLALEDTQVK